MPPDAAAAPRAVWLRLPAPRPGMAVACLVALSVPVLFLGLDRYPVVNADEAFYHDIAWTMLESRDWWRVRTGPGEHVYDTFANAPLQYWVRGFVISLAGPGPFGMRIHSALAGLLAVLATYGLALRAAGRAAGFLAGLLLLFSYQLVYLHGARTGELETGVALLLGALALLFVRAVRRPRAGFLAHHGLLVALAGWKAPVVPIPLLAELACFALVPPARARFGEWLRTGLALLPLALVWHGYQAWRLRELVPQVVEAVGMQAAGSSAVEGIAARGAYYAERVWFGAWPQIALLPAAWLALWPAARRVDSVQGVAVRVIGLYLLAVFGFYCTISKVGPWYGVHAFPFVAASIAIALSDLEWRRVLSPGVLLLGAAGVASIPFVAPPLFDYDPLSASAIRIAMPVSVRGVGALPAWLSISLATAALALVAWLVTRRVGAARPVVAATALAVVVLAAVRVAAPLGDLDRSTPVDALHADLAERRRAGVALSFPIDVPPVHPWIAHYYFGHDYTLRPARPRPGDPGPPWQRYTLVGEGAATTRRIRALEAPLPLGP